MSSHREAPEISKDPVADSTDLYAFVSPDAPDTVTIIANYLPLEAPDGGPNFFEFGENVLYEIHIATNTNQITYQFEFQTQVRNPNTFLYNTGQITSLTDPHWNRFQTYTVTRIESTGPTPPPGYLRRTPPSPGGALVLGSGLLTPPCNIGPRSTPNYAALAGAAVQTLPSGETVFAGQRAEGFYVDLGAVFDLADLRPFQNLHLISTPVAAGVNGTNGFNVHSIAIQIPMSLLTADGTTPTDPTAAGSVIGVWTSASRRKSAIRGDEVLADGSQTLELGPWVQVSRLGNPLVNEVIIPMGKKDRWNALPPTSDGQFVQYVLHPELAALLPVLYPGVFPHLAAFTAPRADLQAILLTGIPAGTLSVATAFQNYTGPALADMLRLNMAIPPAETPNIYGLLALDAAGFPNGRRVFDDVTTIELRAIAGAVLPLIAGSTYTADGAVSVVSDFVLAGTSPADVPVSAPYLARFPYLGVPFDGYSVPPFPATPNSLM